MTKPFSDAAQKKRTQVPPGGARPAGRVVVRPAARLDVNASAPASAARRMVEVVNELLGTGVTAEASRVELHSFLVDGMPYDALINLTRVLPSLGEQEVASVVGLSTRTLRRQKDEPGKFMPADLASKTWQLAETLAKATEVLGSKEDAVRWMTQEAMGLDGARPLDLMRTHQGAELVNDFLGRLEHGVYN